MFSKNQSTVELVDDTFECRRMIIDSQTIGSLVGDTYGRRAMADGR